MKKTALLVLLLLPVAVFLPDQAFAWGPGVHVALGNNVLGHLHLLSGQCAQLLQAYRQSFLYGCLSADILIGKGRKLTPTHCHSWIAGFNLLHTVKEPGLQAYAYGYLGHLAADVVAHNYYVPNELQLSNGRGRLNHVFIEMQADRKTDFCQKQLRNILRFPPRFADDSLMAILQKSKLTFSVKKQVFKGSVALSRINPWRKSLRLMEQRFRKHNTGEYLSYMRHLAFHLVVDCLNNLEHSEAVAFDPMGFENLGLVKRSGRRNGSVVEQPAEHPGFFLPSMNLLSLDS
jgi:hypothetical protein